MSKPNLKPLLYWIKERESIRLKREAGLPPPWTKDPILSTYRFCCVRREDDRVTRWIRKNIREQFADNHNLWLMLCISRQINWPPTLDELITAGKKTWPSDNESFEPQRMAELLDRRQKRGDKIFTSAYLISGSGIKDHPTWSKGKWVAMGVIRPLWQTRTEFQRVIRFEPSLQRVHAMLKEHPGWGDFLSYQAVVDMRFTPLLEKAPDVFTWACAGPGTRRGLNRLYGRPLHQRVSYEQVLKELRYLYAEVQKRVPNIPMDLSDLLSCLCETDKYLRMQNDEGKMRSKFVPSLEPLPGMAPC